MMPAPQAPQARDVSVQVPGTPVQVPGARDNQMPLVELLRVEGDFRAAKDLSELHALVANDLRKVTRARQIFVLERDARAPMSVVAVTGLATVDRTVPLIGWLEGVAVRLEKDTGLDQVRSFDLMSYSEAGNATAQSYPMRQALWIPVTLRTGATIAGALLTRDEPWSTSELPIAQRLQLSLSQAWYWLTTSRVPFRPKAITLKRMGALAAGLLVVGLIPVPLTTLAPVELAPRDHTLVAAPLDGVVKDVLVVSNQAVKAGETIVKFEDTALRSRLDVAEREVAVAEARVKKTTLMAVNDMSVRQELAVAKAELDVKTAERNYARSLLARADVTAATDGIAIAGERRDLIGKPVVIGEKLLEIANPESVQFNITVPVSDAIVLNTGARVKAFLDSDPLNPFEATISRADYQAKPNDAGVLAFRVIAELAAGQDKHPRLGTRGTAQLYGDRVPLAYFVFRRPLTALRQWTGL